MKEIFEIAQSIERLETDNRTKIKLQGYADRLKQIAIEENNIHNERMLLDDSYPLTDVINFPEPIKPNEYNDEGILQNLDIWDWIVTKNGVIRLITDDDMNDLKAEDIKRFATKEEIRDRTVY